MRSIFAISRLRPLIVLMMALADVALAGNTLCINADNVINQLYVDGVDVTSKLVNRAVVRQCDCIPLPANTSTIAVRATNLGKEAGLQACRSAHAAVYDGWRCRNASKVRGENWFGSSYSMKQWQPAKTYKFSKKKSCQHWRQKACKTPLHEWFWAVQQIPNVVCRIDYCAAGCSGCQSTGVGRCDPGKCILGAATENGAAVLDAGGFVTCQRKCCIDIKATGQSETPNSYIRVTDVQTGVVDNWAATAAGRYLATIDLATCITTRRNYTSWANANDRTADTLNLWKSSVLSPDLKNILGVDLGVGADDGGGNSYAPWIDFWRLGVDAENSLYGSNGRSTSFKICLQGVNNRDVAFSDVVGPAYV